MDHKPRDKESESGGDGGGGGNSSRVTDDKKETKGDRDAVKQPSETKGNAKR
jgi:hypothetical protein